MFLKKDLPLASRTRLNLQRKIRGYLTAEEEEDLLLEQSCQQQQQREVDASSPVRLRGKSGTKEPSRAMSTSPPNRANRRAATRGAAGAAGTGGATKTACPETPAKQRREIAVGSDMRRRRPPTAAAFADSSSLAVASGATVKGDVHASPLGGKRRGSMVAGRGGFLGNRTISVPTRGGDEVVVVVPKRPRPIWFAGSGAIQAEWSALPGGARVVRDLEALEEQGR